MAVYEHLYGAYEGESHTAFSRFLVIPRYALREVFKSKLLTTIFGGEDQLDQANRAAAVADLRKQAMAELPMRLARDSARRAIERSFAMPLNAAGFGNAKVVARFASEEQSDDPTYIDQSRSYNEVLEEARRKRQGTQ
jgi:hypothetical protein